MLLLLGLAVFIVIYVLTIQDNIGDTGVYVTNILDYAQSGGSNPSLIWELGHLFWRPIGYVLWQITVPLTSLWFPGNPVTQIEAVLFALNFVGGLALGPLVFVIARRLGLGRPLSLLVSGGILLSSAVLNYVHSGTAYVPGLAVQLTGFWCVLKALQEHHRQRYAILAGIAWGFACDIWFLYILAVPAGLLAEAVLVSASRSGQMRLSVQERLRLTITTATVTGIVGMGSFLMGAALCHVSSVSSLHEWIVSSGHGMHADRSFMRFPTGITRTFFYLGEGGMGLKQFVFGDRYAPIGWTELLQLGLWKIILVFSTILFVIWYLARNRSSDPTLVVLIGATIPTFAFAFLFDTGSPERYLPMYAAIIVAVCSVLKERPKMRIAQSVLGIFLLALVIVNLNAYARTLRTSVQSSERVTLVHQHTRHGGVALIMSFKDPLSLYFHKHPFDPLNQQNALPLYHVFDFATLGSTPWATGASCRILKAWRVGGEAWLSKRFLATNPEREWGWVERDHPSVQWPDVTQFFTLLDKDSDLGGPDGFVRIAEDSKNKLRLQLSCGE